VKAPRLRFAVLASGRGSNALRLIELFQGGTVAAELVLVLSNVDGAPVLAKAMGLGVPVACVPSRGLSRRVHEQRVLEVLARIQVDHLLLAGYMRILSPWFLERFPGRILNIHPSLLPDFPGLDAPRQAWEAGVREAGATVHFVDRGVDSGPVLLQERLAVRGDEGPEGLADRILTEIEHHLYPRAVRLFLDGLGSQEGRP
jgi:phosphoribosylglycinamide formyltransferase-1